jgi:hypothetical protein
VSPLSAERFKLEMTIDGETQEMLLYARDLLGHTIPSGDLAQVLHWALREAIVRLEKQKFGRTSRPRGQRSSTETRYIPIPVRRAVWERDGGRCAFVSEDGHRCGSTQRVEFHHVDPAACGGEATVEDIELRCRAHNQYEAEVDFGVGFMEAKRAAAQQARAAARERAAAEKRAAAEARDWAKAEASERAAIERDPKRSVIPWLRQLGCGPSDAREAAKLCEHMPDAPMEEKIKAALRHLAPRRSSPGCAA